MTPPTATPSPPSTSQLVYYIGVVLGIACVVGYPIMIGLGAVQAPYLAAILVTIGVTGFLNSVVFLIGWCLVFRCLPRIQFDKEDVRAIGSVLMALMIVYGSGCLVAVIMGARDFSDPLGVGLFAGGLCALLHLSMYVAVFVVSMWLGRVPVVESAQV